VVDYDAVDSHFAGHRDHGARRSHKVGPFVRDWRVYHRHVVLKIAQSCYLACHEAAGVGRPNFDFFVPRKFACKLQEGRTYRKGASTGVYANEVTRRYRHHPRAIRAAAVRDLDERILSKTALVARRRRTLGQGAPCPSQDGRLCRHSEGGVAPVQFFGDHNRVADLEF